MDTIGKRLRESRKRAGMTIADLAERVGVSGAAIQQYENDSSGIRLDKAVALAKILDVSLEWLVGFNPQAIKGAGTAQPKTYAPIVDRVQAGLWADVVAPPYLPEDVKYIEIDAKPMGFAVALELEGESMLPEFQRGDTIIIDTGLEPMPGDFVVALTNNDAEATFKKYRPRGLDEDGNPVIELAPLNPDYPTLTINSRNPGRIVGTLIEHRRYRRRNGR